MPSVRMHGARQAGDEVVTNQSLLTRARIYRDQHDLTRGEAMLAEVEPRLRKDLPPGHYAFGSLLSERSLLDLERGDLPSALRLANQAVDAVEAANKAGKAGRNFLPTVYQRRAKVELQAGRPDVAATDVALALNLLQKGSTTPNIVFQVRPRSSPSRPVSSWPRVRPMKPEPPPGPRSNTFRAPWARITPIPAAPGNWQKPIPNKNKGMAACAGNSRRACRLSPTVSDIPK